MRFRRHLLALAAALAAVAPAAAPAAAQDRAALQSTELISRALDGGAPDGPSTNAVISGDRRYARLIAYESDATDLVAGDSNGLRDVFVVERGGSYGNDGSEWRPGATRLVSRGPGGTPANGPSWGAAVDGDFDHGRARCVAFLSAASNLVRGDTNGKVDAFLVRGLGAAPRRVSLPAGRQAAEDTTAVDVSGDCSRVAFVTAGRLYVRAGKKTRKVRAAGPVEDPSFAEGRTRDLVFAGPQGVFLARAGSYRPRLVAAGGRNPVFNNIKRQVVAYERSIGGLVQVAFRDLGQPEKIASAYGERAGNGDSRHPVIGNSGYYIAFETDADNLGTNATGRRWDENDALDVYLYTDVREITLVQSVEEKGIPVDGGGRRPSMSFYANYIVFHASTPLGSLRGGPQIWMRYLGPV
ncbi:MAG TPA: hypothetical protein VF520_14650 [Thermoleophilaceae bacterium]|jgi:hypothetical protein